MLDNRVAKNSGRKFRSRSLMLRSLDEPFTLYGLIAQSIETDDARSRDIASCDQRSRGWMFRTVSQVTINYRFAKECQRALRHRQSAALSGLAGWRRAFSVYLTASLPKLLRHPVVHVISREPVRRHRQTKSVPLGYL